MWDNSDFKAEKYFEGKISIREFLVDFFGALMPGMFFLILLIPVFVLPLYVGIQTLVNLADKNHGNFRFFITPHDLSFLNKIPVTFNISFVFLFLAFGYIIGTLFYRSDPKKPDYHSYLKIRKNSTNDEKDNWVVVISKEAAVEETDVQYPYNNLRGYLRARGRDDLADKIKWNLDEKKSNVDEKSKIFINSLKIRLQFFFPEHCSTIIKNEAHIRLSSSMWFVSNSLRKFCIAGIFLILFSGLFLHIFFIQVFNNNLFELITALSLCIFMLILVYKIKSAIERFLHYQRVREIFYVLDTAMIASKSLGTNGEEMIFREKGNI